MSFMKDIQVIDTILGVDKVYKKAPEIVYPSMQKVTLLTAHIRRVHVPRQFNFRSGKVYTAKMYAEGVFSTNFKKRLFKDLIKKTMLCNCCVVGAWAYMRVGAKTHCMWMKGEGVEIAYIQAPRHGEIEYR